MENKQQSKTTQTTNAFYLQSTISFGVALTSVCIGLLFLPVDMWIRAFLGMAMLYTVTSAFTLAKVIRDRQEETSILSRVEQARVEKILTEHSPYSAAA